MIDVQITLAILVSLGTVARARRQRPNWCRFSKKNEIRISKACLISTRRVFAILEILKSMLILDRTSWIFNIGDPANELLKFSIGRRT